MIAALGVETITAGRSRDALACPNDNLLTYLLNIFARRAVAAMARGVEIG
jgi:hypothetical protein